MKKFLFFLFIFQLLSCSKDADDTLPQGNNNTQIYIPAPGTTFEWRLDDLPNDYSTNAAVVDIDAFSASAELVSHLHANGTKVFAYLSVGSVEDYRPDASDFPAAVIGNVYEGYEDEKWLDIRQINLLGPIMEARLDMIQQKGFDGIEPDNMNGYQNNTGFTLSEEDAKIYSRWLIEKAHERGLSIGQKNAEELVPDLADEFDWILTEDAYVENFYQQLTPILMPIRRSFCRVYRPYF
ncbi:MAG: endo alpha-1,4 polygalactosaminidase [Flavobacteriaceae bacterium]